MLLHGGLGAVPVEVMLVADLLGEVGLSRLLAACEHNSNIVSVDPSHVHRGR